MSLWYVDTAGNFVQGFYGPYPGWRVTGLAVGNNNVPRVMWTKTDGTMSLWDNADVSSAGPSYGPFAGYTSLSLAVDASNSPRVLWSHPSDNTISLWNVAANGTYTYQNYSTPAGSAPKAVASCSNGSLRVLWTRSDGGVKIGAISSSGQLTGIIDLSPSAGDSGGGSGGGGSGSGGGTTTIPHGHYDVTYSGGAVTASDNSTPRSYSLDASSGNYSGNITCRAFGSTSSSLWAKCAGTITAYFAWKADAGYETGPTPTQVTVSQTSTVAWTANSAYATQGSCSTGLGMSHPTISGTSSDTLTETSSLVIPNPGKNFTQSCTPKVDVSDTSGSTCTYLTASASFRAAATFTVPVTAVLEAHSTADTPGWDPKAPRFFSGTNCSATATATGTSSYVTHLQLFVDGTLVKQYDDINTVPLPADATVIKSTGANLKTVSLTVNFDSTHFANGHSIPITMSAKGSGGSTDTYTSDPAKPVTAKASNLLLAQANRTDSWVDHSLNPPKNVAESAVDGDAVNPQFAPGVLTQSVSNNFGGAKIDAEHKSMLIDQIALSDWSVFFAATHSNHGLLGDCYSTTDSDGTTYLTDADIQQAVTLRNNAQSAPYLFVYIHGCDGGGTTTLASDFGINPTALNDRAFVGYPVTIVVNQQNTNFALYLWQQLLLGVNVQDAAYNARVVYPLQRWTGYNTLPASDTAAVIYGDPGMTLHGKVYKWVSGPLWYR